MTIYVTAGGQEYVTVTITETTGKDIHADAVELNFSATYTAPLAADAGWFTPDAVSASGAVVTVRHLVAGAVAAGSYWIWLRLHDGSETVVRRVEQRVTVA